MIRRAERTTRVLTQSAACTYNTNSVAKICGVTLRQLQWWAERDVVAPRQVGHSRTYTAAEVMEISVIAELRRKGYSLQIIRRIMRAVRKKLDKCLDAARAGTEPVGELYLLTDGAAVYLEYSTARVIERLKSARQPMSLVCITDHLCWLESAA